jgi:hypothetical protein
MAALINIATVVTIVAIKAASAAKLSVGYSPGSIESIEESLKTLRIFLVLFTWMVGVGLVLEYKTQLLFICRGLLTLVSLKSNSFDRCLLRKVVWHSLGALLVTVGVLGEFWVEFKQYGAESDLSRASASARDELNVQTSENNKLASENGKEAAQLRKETALIEESLAGRQLSPKDSKTLRDRLAKFHGQLVLPGYSVGDSEAGDFAWDIAQVLHAAKLDVYSPASQLGFARAGVPFDAGLAKFQRGVQVSYTESSRTAAKALVSALNDLGFDAKLNPIGKSMQAVEPKNRIAVWVATRPRGPQGEAKLKLEAAKNKQAPSSQIPK